MLDSLGHRLGPIPSGEMAEIHPTALPPEIQEADGLRESPARIMNESPAREILPGSQYPTPCSQIQLS